jgi:hypothetical protein
MSGIMKWAGNKKDHNFSSFRGVAQWEVPKCLKAPLEFNEIVHNRVT